MLQENQTKFCQSCIERGIVPPNPATREWQLGIFYCDECFDAVISNLTNIAPAAIKMHTDAINGKTIDKGPVLDYLYEQFNIPKELQFDRMETVQRNYDKIFNFYAPSVINRSEESQAAELEQLGASLFYIKYKMEPLEMNLKKMKEERRKEKGLNNYVESKEQYAKTKTPKKASATQEEKMARTLGMTLEEYRKFVEDGKVREKKKREREFNILAGNCPECGGAWPCKEHK